MKSSYDVQILKLERCASPYNKWEDKLYDSIKIIFKEIYFPLFIYVMLPL